MTNYDEIQNVRVVLEKYIEGSYKADVDLLKTVFHEQAGMSGFLGENRVLGGGPEPFFEDLQSRPSMEAAGDDYKPQITYINVVGNVASAIIYQSGFFGEVQIEDHFHLIKDESGEWKIISKIFTTL